MTATALPSPDTVRSRRPSQVGQRPDLAVWTLSGIALLLVALAVTAPLLAPYAPDAVDILAANQGSSPAHWLGTDVLGRDNLSRLLYGARLSLLGPAVVTITATVAGTALALLSTWAGGWVDRVTVRVLDILFSLPALLFAVLAVAVLGAGLTAPAIALSIAYVPYIARVVRSVAVQQRHLPYIESCRLLGYSAWRTSVFHILRNVRLVVVAQATITFAYALLDLAAISFIGLGVQPPASEWGLMVADGAPALLNGNGWGALTAGALIVVTVVTFNVLGERLSARSEAGR